MACHVGCKCWTNTVFEKKLHLERLINVHLLRCSSQTVTQVSPESGYFHYIETKYTENGTELSYVQSEHN